MKQPQGNVKDAWSPPQDPKEAWSPSGETKGCNVAAGTVTNEVRERKQDSVTKTITKVQARPRREDLPDISQEDPAVEVFVRAKLKEWDRDDDGKFTYEEVETAMRELRGTMRRLASLKWQLIIGSVVLSLLLVLMLGAAAIALSLTKDTSVGSKGSLTKSDGTTRIVTSPDAGTGTMPSVLSFDSSSDTWALDDAALRELDAISFTANNGTFYHLQVAQLERFDSGPSGSTDQLDVLTVSGHRLRATEVDDEQLLEVRWSGATQWEQLIMDEATARLLQAEDDFEAEEEDVAAARGAVEPPPRLLSKGHYTMVYVHGRGGSYRCDPAYIDGYHNPDYYCNGAAARRALLGLLLPALALGRRPRA